MMSPEREFLQAKNYFCYVSIVVGEGVVILPLGLINQKRHCETVKRVSANGCMARLTRLSTPDKLLNPSGMSNQGWPVWHNAFAIESESLAQLDQLDQAREGWKLQGFTHGVAALDSPVGQSNGAATMSSGRWQAAVGQAANSFSNYSISVLVYPPAFDQEWQFEIA
jgi:hypothetical protein